MIIDCDRCEMRDIACDDCVVSVLLAAPSAGEATESAAESGVDAGVQSGCIEWHDDESGALLVLAQVGLVPPVRMRPGRHRAADGRAAG